MSLKVVDYQRAIDVQNASNIAGVINSLHEVLGRIQEDLRQKGEYSTAHLNKHPIIVLYASKITSLTLADISDEFSKAYEACLEKVRNAGESTD